VYVSTAVRCLSCDLTCLQVMQVIRDGLRGEGPAFLMKGWTPAWLRLTYVN
jgi:hypothetical protein